MKFFYLLFTTVFGFHILRKEGIRRMVFFIFGVSVLYNTVTILQTPYITISRFLVSFLAFSMILERGSLWRNFKSFPLRYILFLSLVNHMLIGLLDDRLSLFNSLYRSIFQFLTTFFLIFLGYSSLKNIQDLKRLFNGILYLSLFVSVYGVIVFLTKTNVYDYVITRAFDITSTFDFYKSDGRGLRVNAFTHSPITYGVLVSVFFLFLFSFNSYIHHNRLLFAITLFALAFNCFLSNSRTPIFAFIVGIGIFILLSYKFTLKIRVTMISALTFFCLYLLVPFIQVKVDSVADIFITGGERTAGSNLSMREGQFLASAQYFNQHPFWGNGYGYFYENITNRASDGVSGDELYGAESYLFTMMIEEGLIQIILNFILFVSLYAYYFKNFHLSRRLSALGISITSIFIIISLSTGTVEMWQFCMPILGICIRALQLSKLKTNNFYA